VRQAFEQEQLTGLQAARLLGALVDGVVTGLFEHVLHAAGLSSRND
jgi:[protein-PII] uridylyltransferase